MDNASGTLLLVDDDETDIELAIHTINVIAPLLHIDIARNGTEALEYLFPGGAGQLSTYLHSLQVVLLDLHMPGIDGIEVLKRIKSDTSTREIPVVIFSSSRELKDIESSYHSGANGYVVKPIRMDQYEDVMERIIQYWSKANETVKHIGSFPMAHS